MITWLRADERKEAINSLEKTYQFLLEIHEDEYNWKWVIIALHNSIQAFMVLALKGTAPLNVITNPEETLDAIRNGKEYPKEYLLKFSKLYKRIKSEDWMRKSIDSKKFSSTCEIDEAIDRLTEFRNKFVHFIPCAWSIEMIILPQICKQALSIIEFLVFESGNIRFYDDDDSTRIYLKELIMKTRKELEGLEVEYSNVVFGRCKEEST